MGTISTAKQAAAAKPGKHRVSGADGLYLNVGASGGASWFFRYSARIDGKLKRREMGLGSRVSVSIDDARQKTKKLDVQHGDGQDPIETQLRARATAKAKREADARRITFARAADDYLEANAPTWKHQYARAHWRGTIAKYALPVLGDMMLEDVESRDIAEVMTAADSAGNTETARRLRSEIFKVIERARALRQFDRDRLNPADAYTMKHAKPMKRRGERQHYRAVQLKKAPATFRQLRERAASDTAFAAWVFMIATATRGSEALKARWSEIDLDEGLWTIPARRMKKSRTHVVPLNSIARDILERQANIRRNDLVFPGAISESVSYALFARAPAKTDIDAATPHGWRSVFRDWAGDKCTIENKGELAEFALAHVLGPTEGAYRRSTGDRKPLLEAYARWLETDGANVIPFQSVA
jgi:integrase